MQTGKFSYPTTPKGETVEELFGHTIQDPYRWLEDDNSPQTLDWLKAQQAFTVSVLDRYPNRKAMLSHLKELVDYPRQSVPIKRGDWYYYAKNDGLQNQWVSWRKRKDGAEEIFFDPNTLSEDGTTQASITGISKDCRYCTFRISQAGADEAEFWIMEVESKTFLADKLTNIRHSGAAWYRDGFFYSRYDDDHAHQKQVKDQKIYYHRLGEPQEQDRLIYADPANPFRYTHISVSDDQNTLFLYISQGTHGIQIMFRPANDHQAPWSILLEGFEYNAYHIDSYDDGWVYLITNKDAKNFRLVKVNLKAPAEEHWLEVIPQRDYLLDSAHLVGGKLIAIFTKDVQSHIEVMDPDGNFLYSIEMPYQGTADISYFRKEDEEAYFYFNSYVRPDESYHYDIKSNKLSFHHCDPVKCDLSDVVSNQVFYPSRDGSLIPMTLIHKQGVTKDGNNPVYLYGYGGFNISLMPSFSIIRTVLIEKGFILAIANLRGGGEYGEHWHEAGMLFNKQNVFDDFIAAAEYLISEGYSQPERIAINGGSNGGLLVGACLAQRPELFKVAVPMMGVLDMLRYHKFTCGWGWIPEYGDPDQESHFRNLLAYSPLHNIQAGQKYPAIMITTADHDDRVVPGHSFKYAATLQEKVSNEEPVLLYTQFQSSHHPSNITKSLELWADVFSFMCLYLEVD